MLTDEDVGLGVLTDEDVGLGVEQKPTAAEVPAGQVPIGRIAPWQEPGADVGPFGGYTMPGTAAYEQHRQEAAASPLGDLARVAQPVARVAGRTLGAAGRLVKDITGAYVFEAIGEPELQAQQLGIDTSKIPTMGEVPPSEEKPLEEGMRLLPTYQRLPSEALYGLIETTPRLAGVAGLQAMGVPAPLAAGAVFGLGEEGFDPAQGAIAAALPFVGKYSGEIAGLLAKQLGVSSTAALNLVKGAGGLAGPAAGLIAEGEREISQLPADQQAEARIKLWANVLGQSALGPMGVKYEKARVPVTAPTGAELVMPRGARPPARVKPPRATVPEGPTEPTIEAPTGPEFQQPLPGDYDSMANRMAAEAKARGAKTIGDIQTMFPVVTGGEPLSRAVARDIGQRAFGPEWPPKPPPPTAPRPKTPPPAESAGAPVFAGMPDTYWTRANFDQALAGGQRGVLVRAAQSALGTKRVPANVRPDTLFNAIQTILKEKGERYAREKPAAGEVPAIEREPTKPAAEGEAERGAAQRGGAGEEAAPGAEPASGPPPSEVLLERERLQKELAEAMADEPLPPEAPKAPEPAAEPAPPPEKAAPPVVRDVPPASVAPETIVPAVRLVGGKVIEGRPGETHPDIIAREKIKAEDIDQRGFWNGREFLDREAAAKGTALPTEREAGRLHSTDLPAAKEPIPRVVSDAIERFKREGEKGSDWAWFNASPAERVAVDDWLLKTKHPSIYEPGTAENRFRSIVREMTAKEPATAESKLVEVTKESLQELTKQWVQSKSNIRLAIPKLGTAARGAYDKSKRKGMTGKQLEKLAAFDKLVEAEKQAAEAWRAARKIADTSGYAANKVEAEIEKVRRTEGSTDAKEVKSQLVSELEKAIEEAPDETNFPGLYFARNKRRPIEGEVERILKEAAKTGEVKKITIEIPGDGKFTVWNTKQNLQTVLDRAKKISTSTKPPKGYTERKPYEELPGAIKTKADWEAMREYYGIEDADTIHNWSPYLRKVAEKLADKFQKAPEQITAADVDQWIKRQLAIEAAPEPPPAPSTTDEARKASGPMGLGLSERYAWDHLQRTHGLAPGGTVEIVNIPDWNAYGGYNRNTGKVLLNLAHVTDTAHLDRILEHEVSHLYHRTHPDTILARIREQLTPKEFADIQARIEALGYKPEKWMVERTAYGIQRLAESWRNRGWFQHVVGDVMRWASYTLGMKLSRLAAESAAVRVIAEGLEAARKGSAEADGKGVLEMKAPASVDEMRVGEMYERARDDLRKYRGAFRTIFNAQSNRKLMDQRRDAADNAANIMGQRMGKRVSIGASKADDVAASAIVASGFDRERLQGFLNNAIRGRNPEAEAGVRLAMSDWDRLQPIARRGARIFDEQIASEEAAGINTQYHENYLPGIYDRDLMMGVNRPFVIGGSGGGGTSTGFKKGKAYPTPFDAIGDGHRPRTLQLSKLVEHRVRVGQHLINLRDWATAMRDVFDPTDNMPIVTDLERRARPGDMPGYEVAPSGYTPREIIPGTRIAVHEAYSKLFDALTGTSKVGELEIGGLPVGSAALMVGGAIKHGMLAFDTFHASRIMQKQLFLTGEVGYKRGLALLEYSPQDLARAVRAGEITQDMANYANANRPQANLLVREGLNVGRINEGLYSSLIRDLPIIGTFNKWVFDKMSRGAIMQSAIIEFDRVKAANPQMPDAQVARQVSRDLNAYFGNLGRQGIWKSKTFQDLSRLFFLAPQWAESMVRSEVGAARQLAKVPVDAALGRGLKVGTLARGMAQGLGAYFIATQLLNLATRRQFTWQNEEKGHKLDAWIPDVTGKTRGFFISPLAVVAEMTHDLLRYSRSEPDAIGAASRILGNKTSPFWRAGRVFWTGETWDKTKLVGATERLLGTAVALAPTPLPLSSIGKGVPGGTQRQITASLGLKTEPVESERAAAWGELPARVRAYGGVYEYTKWLAREAKRRTDGRDWARDQIEKSGLEGKARLNAIRSVNSMLRRSEAEAPAAAKPQPARRLTDADVGL